MFLIGLYFLTEYDESRGVDTGEVFTYEKQEELDLLIKKSQEKGLSQEEQKYLQFLIEDQKNKFDERVSEMQKRGGKGDPH